MIEERQTVQLLNNSGHSAKRWFFLLALMLSASFWCFTKEAEAQSLGTNYIWADSLQLSTTIRDSSRFSVAWEQVVIRCEGDGGYFQFASPDSTGISSQDWTFLDSGESISFGPGTRLIGMRVKGVSANTDVYMIGYKKTRQD